MRQINLLPSELKPSRKINIALKRVEKYAVILLALYLLMVGISIGTIYFLNQKLANLQNTKNALSSELTSLTSVESSIIYIRDRVTKYNQIGDRNAEIEGLELANNLIAGLPTDISTANFKITKNTIGFRVNTLDTRAFSQFLDTITKYGEFEKATFSGISYNPEKGYQFEVNFSY